MNSCHVPFCSCYSHQTWLCHFLFHSSNYKRCEKWIEMELSFQSSCKSWLASAGASNKLITGCSNCLDGAYFVNIHSWLEAHRLTDTQLLHNSKVTVLNFIVLFVIVINITWTSYSWQFSVFIVYFLSAQSIHLFPDVYIWFGLILCDFKLLF